jgi:hypothetical protein
VIAELFKPLEIECLIRTAVELWEQSDTTDLSEPQQDVLDRARHAMYREDAGEPLPDTQIVTPLQPSAAQDVWVLRRWDRHTDEVTIHTDEDTALAALAEQTRSSWDTIAGLDDNPDEPPHDDREVVDLYYGPDRDARPDQGYSIYKEQIAGRPEAPEPTTGDRPQ